MAAEDWPTMSSIELAGQQSCSRPPSSGADLNSSSEGHMPRIFFSRPSSLRATARRMKEGGSDLRYFSLLNDQRQSESISLEVRDFSSNIFFVA